LYRADLLDVSVDTREPYVNAGLFEAWLSICEELTFDINPPLSYSVCLTQAEASKLKSIPKTTPDKELIKAFEAAGVVDYLEYLQSGKRIMWVNFKAGIARGFGITVGMTVVVAVFIWVLTMLVDLPVIGEHFAEAKQSIDEYKESTNYSDEFKEMNQLLRDINENLKN